MDLAPGPYQLLIRVEPAEGDSAMPTLTRQPLRVAAATHPDLTIQEVQLPPRLILGRVATLRFDTANASPRPTETAWTDRAYLSLDEVVSDDDLPLAEVVHAQGMGPLGRLDSGPMGIVIPPDAAVAPQMFVLVVADADRQIDEGPFEDNNVHVQPIELLSPEQVETPEDLELGREDEPQRLTVAWIAHDDFAELQARQSRTEQPMLQDEVEPTPGAPLETRPDATASAAPTPPSPVPSPPAAPARQTAAATPDPPPATPDPGDLPSPSPGPEPQPGQDPATAPGVDNPTPPRPTPSPPSPPTQTAATDEPTEGDKPTSIPRSDREADPTRLLDSDQVVPGGVLVGPGLEVKTFRPRFSAAAQLTVPRNPTAVITFDPDGTVLDAQLPVSTGFSNVDAPILASLYRWQATGDRLTRMQAPFQVRITILLNGARPSEPRDGEE